MSISLGDAILFLKANRDQLNKDLNSTETDTRNWAQRLGSGVSSMVGGVVTAGVGAAAAGIGALTFAATKGIGELQSWAGTLDGIGDVLGTNALQSAGLAVAIQSVGGNVDALTGQMAFMTRGLTDAQGQLGPTGKALADMGVAFQDANGQMLPATDILQGVADKLAAMPDGLEKTKLMTEIFGKSGKDLGDVMNALANGGMDAAQKKAQDLGLALSDNTVAASIEAGKQMETLKMGVQGFFVTIGANLLPILMPFLTMLISLATGAMPGVSAAIQDVIAWMAPFIDQFMTYLPVALQFVSDLWTTTLWPALQAMGDWFLNIGWPAIQQFATEVWSQLGPGLAQLGVWGQQLAALVLPLLAQAWQWVSDNMNIVLPILAIIGVAILALTAPITLVIGAVALLATAWANDWGGIQEKAAAVWAFIEPLITGAVSAIGTAISTFLTNAQTWWSTHGTQIMTVVNTLWTGVQTAFNTAVSILTSVFAAFKAAFEGDWTAFGTNLRTAWDTLWTAVSGAFSTWWTGFQTIISGMVTSIGNFFTQTDWGAVGTAIVNGIANGLAAGATTIANAAKAAAQAALDAAKGFLGIQSPSKVFHDQVGVQIAAGIGEGFSDRMNQVKRDMGAGLAGLASNVSSQVTNNATLNIYTNAPTEQVVADFGGMTAFGRA